MAASLQFGEDDQHQTKKKLFSHQKENEWSGTVVCIG